LTETKQTIWDLFNFSFFFSELDGDKDGVILQEDFYQLIKSDAKALTKDMADLRFSIEKAVSVSS
jgi:hypothetical protein